jgi:hypothetical protein
LERLKGLEPFDIHLGKSRCPCKYLRRGQAQRMIPSAFRADPGTSRQRRPEHGIHGASPMNRVDGIPTGKELTRQLRVEITPVEPGLVPRPGQPPPPSSSRIELPP